MWTNGVFTEYASAAAFSALNIAFLECQAPVDLCAAAADFAVDELGGEAKYRDAVAGMTREIEKHQTRLEKLKRKNGEWRGNNHPASPFTKSSAMTEPSR